MLCSVKAILLVFIVGLAGAKVRYDGNEVWRVDALGSQIEDVISKFSLDVWAVTPSFTDIRIPPQHKNEIISILQQKKITYDVMIKNVQELIDAEDKARSNNLQGRAFGYDKYNNFSEIEDKLFEISQRNPDTTLVTIGTSIEGRELWQLRFSTGGDKPVAWFDCGMHAREWISPATCLYGIDKFDQKDPQFAPILDTYDVYFIPIDNPDGYEWTWVDTRLWRKNRNDNSNADGLCYGVDLNRNFDAYWGGLGTTNITCGETYRGVSPASEIETQNIQAAVEAILPKVLFSLHAYSQMWFYPYSYDYVTPPQPITDELHRVAAIGVASLTATYGTNYTFGPTAATIYPAAGASIDFVYDAGVTYSYELELRDTGEYGFLLPEDQILPTGEETWNGFIAALNAIP